MSLVPDIPCGAGHRHGTAGQSSLSLWIDSWVRVTHSGLGPASSASAVTKEPPLQSYYEGEMRTLEEAPSPLPALSVDIRNRSRASFPTSVCMGFSRTRQLWVQMGRRQHCGRGPFSHLLQTLGAPPMPSQVCQAMPIPAALGCLCSLLFPTGASPGLAGLSCANAPWPPEMRSLPPALSTTFLVLPADPLQSLVSGQGLPPFPSWAQEGAGPRVLPS